MVDDAASRYDFSEYPLEHPLYDTSNRKALEFFKDELNSVPMREFVGLRPKCYAFLCAGKMDKNALQHTKPVKKKKTKGVKKKTATTGILRTIWTCYVASNRMAVSNI